MAVKEEGVWPVICWLFDESASAVDNFNIDNKTFCEEGSCCGGVLLIMQ